MSNFFPALMTNRLYTIQEAADILGVSTKTLRRWDQRGRFVPTRTAGNQRRYTEEQINKFKVSPSEEPLFDLNKAPEAPEAAHSLPSALSGLPSGSFLRNHFLLKHKDEIESKTNLELGSFARRPPAKLNPFKVGFVVASLVLILSFGGALVLTKYNVVAGLTQTKEKFAKLIANLPHIDFNIKPRDLSFVPQADFGSVLAAAIGGSDLALNINIPTLFSQNVGIGTATPDSSSVLDLTSQDQGFLAPRMTTVQRDAIASPATGLFVYNTDTNQYNMYNGTSWGSIGGITKIGDAATGEAFTETGTSGTALYFYDADGRGKLTIANLTGVRTYTLPDVTGEVSLLGQTISNSELVSKKVTVSPGTNMTGGGDVELGSSITLTLKDSVSLAGTLTVAGASTLTGATAITGALTANGNVTLGDAITDTITFTGRVAEGSSLIPIGTTGTNDLGSASLPWDNIYADNIVAPSSGSSGYLQRNSGALSPTNITDDILLGATSTASALIKFSGTSGNNSWFNTGNVGIGTTSPGQKLHVSGQIGLDNANENKILLLDGTDKAKISYAIGDFFDLYAGNDAAATGVFRFFTGDSTPGFSEKMRITKTGNVGIGNTTPLTALDVTGSASLSANISLRGAGTAHTFNILDNGTLNFQKSPSGDTGLVSRMSVNDSSTVFNEDSADIDFRIESNDNANMFALDAGLNSIGIGIAPTNSNSALRVAFPTSSHVVMANLVDVTTLTDIATSESIYGLSVSYGASRTTAGDFTAALRSIVSDVRSIAAANPVNWTNAFALRAFEANVILQAPSAGTHTITGAAGLLDNGPVIGTGVTLSTYYGHYITNGSGAGTLTTQYGLYIENLTKGGSDYGIYIAGADTYALWVDAGTTRLDGNVGIGGQTTPLTALDVTGSASLSANIFLRGAATAHTFNILDNGTLNFQRSPGGDAGFISMLFIQNNGNIGIGTSNPSYKLDISGGSLNVFATSSAVPAFTVTQAGTGKLAEFKTHLPGVNQLTIDYASNELSTIIKPKSSLEFRLKSGVVWTAKTAWDITSTADSNTTPAFADLDNDGDYDLLVGADLGRVFGYENTGTNASPTWTAKSAWDNTAVLTDYDNSKPALADLDNDGDYDLLIGTNLGRSYGFENTGSVSSPTWTAKTAWDTPDAGSVASPAFADLDNDGDYDLLIGETAGKSKGYENTGTVSSPTWTAKTAWDTPDVGSGSAPAIADLDNDGDYDLLIGQTSGISYGFENTGSALGPVWTAKTSWDTVDTGTNSAPAIADLDNDGDYDLFVGQQVTTNGKGYENTGSYTSSLALGNNGLIGIGIASPSATLDVRANLSIGGTIPVASISGVTSFAGLLVDNSGVGDLLTASKSGATKFVITNAGNVGIGTTTPGEMLSVGSSTPTLVSSAGLITVANTTDSTSGTTGSINTLGGLGVTKDLAVDGGDIVTAATTFNLVNATATTISFAGAATTALNIGNGNTAYTAINIGSGTGGNTINIAGTGATGADTINIGTGATGADTINLGSSALTTAVNVTTGTGVQTYTSNVATGATTTSGFVFDATAISSGTGIYAVSDSVTTGRLLDIATSGNTWLGNGTTNGLINIASASTGGTGSSQSILLNLARSGTNANTAHTAYGVYSAVTNTNVTSGTNIAGYFSASGATTANYGLIVANGNVGIGSTAPEALLEIQGAEGTDAILALDADDGDDNADTWFVESEAADNDLSFVNHTTEVFKITSAGNIGIGTAIPLTALDVTGSASLSANISMRGAGTAHTFNILDNGTLNFQRSPGGDAGVATVLYLENSGNVGIGTTSPTSKLSVAGASSTISNSSGDLTINPAGQLIFPDDDVVNFGTSQDIAMVLNSAGVAANTTLTDVLIGTPVTATTPANSLLTSNITASGDMAWYLNDGAGNSWEYLRFDGSADLTVFNEAGSDIDFRIESDTDANAVLLDSGLFAGVGQLSIGSAAQSTVTGFTVIDNPAITATSNQDFYKLLVDNSAAVTITGSTTSPIVASLAIDEPNITATGTVTNAVSLYVQAAPTEGGTGNYALWVDAGTSRFDSDVLIGSSGTSVTIDGNVNRVQISGTTEATSSLSLGRWSNDVGAGVLYLNKSRNGTVGSFTVVASGDRLGTLHFTGDDGVDYNSIGATIAVEVDGTPGSNDMPGRLMFYTTLDGAASGTERMRITNAGNIGMGGQTTPLTALDVTGSASLSANLSLRGSGTAHTFNILDNGTLNFQKSPGGDTGAASRMFIGDSTTVFNEDSADIDFRIESDGNANMFVVDAANNNIGIGTLTDAGIRFGIHMTFPTTIATNQGTAFQVYGNTVTDAGGARTVATQGVANIAEVTYTNASDAVTISDAASLWIQGAPIAGTNFILTRPYALWVDAGTSRFDGAIAFGDETVDIGTTTVGLNDLHFGSGGIINFDGGDVTLTHAANALTIAGGDTFIGNGNGVVLGHTAQLTIDGVIPEFQMLGTALVDSAIATGRWSADAGAPNLYFLKSRETTIGSFGIVAADDRLGEITWMADDGVDYNSIAAYIRTEVDGTPGSNDIPTRMVFAVAADGAASPTEHMRINNAGNVGIGTTAPLLKLDVRNSQAATVAAQISNTSTNVDADGMVIKLGNTSASAVASTNHFLSFETFGIGIVGSVQGSGGTGVTYATSGIADFAEYFKKDASHNIPFGSAVCFDEAGLAVACDNNSNKIIGVASKRPAFLGGENLGDRSIAVGLVGQVRTRVSTANGVIKIGDPLTTSSIPGVVVKATSVGQILGKAIEGFDPSASSGQAVEGEILVSVNITWYNPSVYVAMDGTLAGITATVSGIEEQLALQGQALRSWEATSSANLAEQVNSALQNDPLFDSLNNKVSDLESKLNLLSQEIEQQASISAFLTEIVSSQVLGASTSAELNLGDIELNNATITDNLMVLGYTTITSLGVTGNITAGLLAIHGLDGEINTLGGDLYLQKTGLGGVDILNGLVVIDTTGNMIVAGTITADAIEANNYTVLGGESIGSAEIPAGSASIEISTSVASASSKIFLTATSLTTSQLTVVKKSDGKFKVAIPSPTTSPISFDWWIVGNK